MQKTPSRKKNYLPRVYHQIFNHPHDQNNKQIIDQINQLLKKIIHTAKKNNISSLLPPNSPFYLKQILTSIKSIKNDSFIAFFKEIQLQKRVEILSNESSQWNIENETKKVNDSIRLFSQDRNLLIKDKKITIVPKEIQFFSNLMTLTINNNHIHGLPDEITQLKRLLFFECNHNRLKSLPKQFDQLRLISVKLENNCFTEAPDQLFKIQTLAILFLNKNQIQKFPNINPNSPSLHALDLSDNEIQTIPKILWKLPNLDTLVLKNNPLHFSNIAGRFFNKSQIELSEYIILKKVSTFKYFQENIDYYRDITLAMLLAVSSPLYKGSILISYLTVEIFTNIFQSIVNRKN